MKAIRNQQIDEHRCFHCKQWIPSNSIGAALGTRLQCSHCNGWQPLPGEDGSPYDMTSDWDSVAHCIGWKPKNLNRASK